MTQLINPKKFTDVTGRLRSFFLSKGFQEVHTQNRLSILAACEDPTTVATYEYAGEVWPLPQTGQMWLEYELLNNPDIPGFFCISTSYRDEKNITEGRHDIIFPMFEFEFPGNIKDLEVMERELCEHVGFGNKHSIVDKDYLEWCEYFDLYISTSELVDYDDPKYKLESLAPLSAACDFYLSDLSFDRFSKIRVDKQNNAWVTTADGLRVIRSNGQIWPDNYSINSENTKLLSNIVHNIIFDDYGYIYIATEYGISIFESVFRKPRKVIIVWYNPKYENELKRLFRINKIKEMHWNNFGLFASRCFFYEVDINSINLS